ncbi:MAG: TMEM175 family protein [Clostridiales Family XIII bacterium]|jgi:uncharacterized membrane protein|nr:TMEM175 family protein [Clostridiales Family XIII bacterium]
MSKTRLEAFTDAIIAIIMTILVLELRPPDGFTAIDIYDLRYEFIVYAVSFVTLAIYWMNHHNLFQKVSKIDNTVLWLNTLLILPMSLFPFTTAWLNINITKMAPNQLYGAILIVTDLIYFALVRHLKKIHQNEGKMERLDGTHRSEITIAIIAAGIIIGIWFPPAVLITCVGSLLFWISPDEQIYSQPIHLIHKGIKWCWRKVCTIGGTNKS